MTQFFVIFLRLEFLVGFQPILTSATIKKKIIERMERFVASKIYLETFDPLLKAAVNLTNVEIDK